MCNRNIIKAILYTYVNNQLNDDGLAAIKQSLKDNTFITDAQIEEIHDEILEECMS